MEHFSIFKHGLQHYYFLHLVGMCAYASIFKKFGLPSGNNEIVIADNFQEHGVYPRVSCWQGGIFIDTMPKNMRYKEHSHAATSNQLKHV